MIPEKNYDIAIIGGGINGTGIAREAAGHGLKVMLCEQNDLAAGTSSRSSKLIHGGLRYLEYHEFRLVREALKEREILLKMAPHLIHPLQFIMPHQKNLRPAWMIQLGLFLYDHLSRRSRLPGAGRLDLRNHAAGIPLSHQFKKGFFYYDCFADDARLVISNAKSARELGADIHTRLRCTGLQAENHGWQIQLLDTRTRTTRCVRAKVLVNATGPWLNDIIALANMKNSATAIQLVKGSHIIVPKMYQGPHAYILQLPDRRVVFVIPYQQDFTLIGTTDIEYGGSPEDVEISQGEIEYLCAAVNQYFKKEITANDVVSHYSGVRALQQNGHDDPSAITRDYKLDFIGTNSAAFLNVAGGKITTYRKLAEHAMHLITPLFQSQITSWDSTLPITGGAIPEADLSAYFRILKNKCAWLPSSLLHRYITHYGSACETFLECCETMDGLGQHFGHGLYEREIQYLIKQEWVITSDDILWRRTKLGLYFSSDEKAELDRYLEKQNFVN